MTQHSARQRRRLVDGGKAPVIRPRRQSTWRHGTKILSLIGIDSFTCCGAAAASLVTGVTGPP